MSVRIRPAPLMEDVCGAIIDEVVLICFRLGYAVQISDRAILANRYHKCVKVSITTDNVFDNFCLIDIVDGNFVIRGSDENSYGGQTVMNLATIGLAEKDAFEKLEEVILKHLVT